MKKRLLLLHGALESGAQFDKIVDSFKDDFELIRFDFQGHGSQGPIQNFEIGELSNQLKNYLEENDLKDVNILGYSMGGYVALYALPTITDRIDTVFTLATKLSWTEEFIQKELLKLNTVVIEEKVPKLIVKLEQEHPKSPWKSMIKATRHMIQSIQCYPLDYSAINASQKSIFILRGQEDNMVTDLECLEAADKISKGQYIQLADTPHMLHKMNTDILLKTIKVYQNK